MSTLAQKSWNRNNATHLQGHGNNATHLQGLFLFVNLIRYPRLYSHRTLTVYIFCHVICLILLIILIHDDIKSQYSGPYK